MSKEPTILVKKSDGQTERISLEEFQKRKDRQDDLMVLPENNLATISPVLDFFKNQTIFNAESDYHKSLLDEDFSEIAKIKDQNNKNSSDILLEKKEEKKDDILYKDKKYFDDFINKASNLETKKTTNFFTKDEKIDDIKSPEIENKKRTSGPVEEILNFSLLDFSRLSNDPKKATEILLMKFENIKKESYFLYTNFVKAWKKSPLFKLYTETVFEALKKNQTIEKYCEENKEISWKQFLSLLELNQQIKK